MSGKSGHRAWGHINRQRIKTPSYQASFIGPDLRRHYAPHTLSSRMNAMRRLIHKTAKAALLYQHAYDDSGKKLAAGLSANALAELAASVEEIDATALADAQ